LNFHRYLPSKPATKLLSKFTLTFNYRYVCVYVYSVRTIIGFSRIS